MCGFYELSELSSIRSARDIETVKGFVTSTIDHYRAPYERRTKDWPRQCIFAGSTNDHDCLNDSSGNRRWWPADCGQIDIDGLRDVVDQLWAEADARYQSNEPGIQPRKSYTSSLGRSKRSTVSRTLGCQWCRPG